MSLKVISPAVGSAALCFALAAPARSAELAGSTIEVTRTVGAESCPDAESLKERTLTIGKPRLRAELLRIQVEFRRSVAGYSATLHTSGRSTGKRELSADGPSCEPLAQATSVVLAVLLDLLPPGESAPLPDAPPPLPTASAAKSSVFEYLALGARAGVQYGVFGPSISASFGGEARLRLARVELGLGGFHSPGRSVDLAPGVVSASLTGGSLGVCGYRTVRTRELELGACALLSLARFAAFADGFQTDGDAASLWIAGGIGATLSLSLGRHWALRAGLDVIMPFRQYRPQVERVGFAYDALAVAMALNFGPEWRFR
jgi:hypothetical protein